MGKYIYLYYTTVIQLNCMFTLHTPKKIDWLPIVVAFLLTLFFLSSIYISNDDRPLDHELQDKPPPEKMHDTTNIQKQVSESAKTSFFIQNKGQIQGDTLYYYLGNDTSIYFDNKKITYVHQYAKEYVREDIDGIETFIPKDFSQYSITETYQTSFVDANDDVTITPHSQTKTSINYFKGAKDTWRSNIPTYEELVYENIYTNIDLSHQFSDTGVKSDFFVHPGGDPHDILIQYDGVEQLSIDEHGDLLIDTTQERFYGRAPLTYQVIDGKQTTVESSYIIEDGTKVRYDIGTYDPTVDLIIDPITDYLVDGTFWGINGSEFSFAIDEDSSGNIYVGGTMTSDMTMPEGAYDTTYGGGQDGYIAKFNHDLSDLLTATYIGGSNYDEVKKLVISDDTIYFGGSTRSADFPTTTGAYDTESSGDGNWDMYMASLSTDLTTLNASTLLGGSAGTDVMHSFLMVDSDSLAAVGYTGSSDYPTSTGAYSPTFNGGVLDGVVSILSTDLTTLEASTFIGGDAIDAISDAVIYNSEIIMTGLTAGGTFPTSSAGYSDTYIGGTYDGIILKMNLALDTLSAVTYFGGTGKEELSKITVGTSGAVYVHGVTDSIDLPTTTDAFGPNFSGGTYDSYLVKMDNGLTTAQAVSYLGGSDVETAKDIIIDSDENVLVLGNTVSSDFPTTADAYDTSYNDGGRDWFLAKTDNGFLNLTASTYIGGSIQSNVGDTAEEMIIASDGTLYIAGVGEDGFPFTSDSYQPDHFGSSDTSILRFYTNPPITPIITATTTPTDGSGNISLTIDVNDADNENLSLLLNYKSGVCDGDTTSLSTSTITDTYTFSQTTGSESVSTASTSAWHIQNLSTASATNSVAVVWDSEADLSNTEGNYCIFVKTNDGISNSSYASTTVAIDNILPTAPGALTVNTTSSESMVLNLAATSTDTNFNEYKIYYMIGSSGVSVASGTAFTSSSDTNLATSTFNNATTTEIIGLIPNTQYVANIWAFDNYRNNASSTQEVTFLTLANPPTELTLLSAGKTNITATWNTNDNSTSTNYYVQNVSASTAPGWNTNTSWDSTDLSCGTSYTFSIKARNSSSIETETISATLDTAACSGGGGFVHTPPPVPDTDDSTELDDIESIDPPVVTNISNGSVFTTLPIEIIGTAKPHATVLITVYDTEYSVKADDAGVFKTTILETIEQGIHTLTLKQTDSLGQTSEALLIHVVYKKKDVTTPDETIEPSESFDEATTDTHESKKVPPTTPNNATTGATAVTISESIITPQSTLSDVAQIITETTKRNAFLLVHTRDSVTFRDHQTKRIETTSGGGIDLLVRPEQEAHSITARLYQQEQHIAQQTQAFNTVGSNSFLSRLRTTLFKTQVAHAQTTKQEQSHWIKGYMFEKDTTIDAFAANIDLPSLRTGTYKLVVSINYEDGTQTHITKPISISKPGTIISEGTCQQNNTISKARIEIMYQNHNGSFVPWPGALYGNENPIITDTEGRYTLHLPAGAYYLKIDAPRHDTHQTNVFVVDAPTIINEHIILPKKPSSFWQHTFDWIQRLIFGVECVYNTDIESIHAPNTDAVRIFILE